MTRWAASRAQQKGKTMKAEEARRISEQNLKGAVIEPLLAVAYGRIKEAAEQGKRKLYHPFYGAKDWPTLEERNAALQRLREDGYTVEHHNNPDPGDPRSSDYDEVSW